MVKSTVVQRKAGTSSKRAAAVTDASSLLDDEKEFRAKDEDALVEHNLNINSPEQSQQIGRASCRER